MDITEKELLAAIPKLVAAGGGSAPEWLGQVSDIAKNIKDLLTLYKDIQGKPAAQIDNPFAPAIGSKNPPIYPVIQKEVINMPSNEFKELLEGLIKTINIGKGMGYGDKLIGEVINSLPLSLTQIGEFLNKLYQKRYGDDSTIK